MADTQPSQSHHHVVDPYDLIMSRIAIGSKLLTKEQLSELISIQQKVNQGEKKVSLEIIISKKQLLPEKQVQALRNATKRKLGMQAAAIAMKKGFITQQQVTSALQEQADEFKKSAECRRLLEILLDKGLIDEGQKAQVEKDMGNGNSESKPEPEPKTKPPPPLETKVEEKVETKSEQKTEQTEPRVVGESTIDIDISDLNTCQIIPAKDGLKAHLVIPARVIEPVTLESVKQMLAKEGIVYGIVNDEIITDFLAQEAEEAKELIIAKGKKPVQGEPACIKFYFDTDYLKPGIVDEKGRMDFKSRGDIPQVKTGDLIAEKIRAQVGEDGKDIYGRAFTELPKDDVRIKAESGVKLSDDGLKVYAAIDGYPNVTIGGKISVFSEFVVNGDVNHRTGNIDYEGNIVITGMVHDDFTVRGGNIKVKEINAAKIYSKGDVIVEEGIVGAKIEAEGKVVAKYITSANIKAYEDIMVEKSIIESNLQTSGQCMIPTGDIIASLVAAKQGMVANNVGSDKSKPCTLVIGADEHIRTIIQGFEKTHKMLVEALTVTQNKYNTLYEKQNEMVSLLSNAINKQKSRLDAQREKHTRILSSGEIASSKEVSEAKTQMKETQLDAKQLIGQLEHQFKEQENLFDAIDDSYKTIVKLVKEIESINEQKKAVILWSEKQEHFPKAIIKGQVFSKTHIYGRHSQKEISDTIRELSIEEVKSEDKKLWEIRMRPLK